MSTSLSLPFRTVKNFNIKISVLEIIGPLKSHLLEIRKLRYLCLVKRGYIYRKLSGSYSGSNGDNNICIVFVCILYSSHFLKDLNTFIAWLPSEVQEDTNHGILS